MREMMEALGIMGLQRFFRRALGRMVSRSHKVPEKFDVVVAEITTYCNLKCAGCVRTIHSQEQKWNDRHVGVENFRKLVNDLPPARIFNPQGVGEPTMHPQILELLKIASESGKFDSIEINSNALVRSTEFYEQLFDAGLTMLYVSIDSFDDTLANAVRGGTDIEKLGARIEEFAKRFPDNFGVRITVSKWNLDDLPNTLRRLSEIGKIKVWMQPFYNMGNNAGVLSSEQARQLTSRLRQFRREFPDLTITAEPMEPSENICHAPWRSPAITVDGQVKPCCMIMHQEPIEFGNAFQQNFMEIWNSPNMNGFRQEFNKKSPDCCRDCPYYKFRD